MNLEKILHSKLQTNLWPNISQVLKKIHFFLPKIPQIDIILYKENHQNVYDENDNANEQIFSGFKVKLVSNYENTQSQQQLQSFLNTNQQEKEHAIHLQRQQRSYITNKSFRPYSAKGQFTLQRGNTAKYQVNDPMSQLSLFKTSNQIYQKNFQSYTILPNMRPISASTNPQLQSMQFSESNYGQQNNQYQI